MFLFWLHSGTITSEHLAVSDRFDPKPIYYT